jgi:hypothetical protein
MFSLIIGNEDFQYYFNWYHLIDHLGGTLIPQIVLGIESLEFFADIFNDKSIYWYLMNPKFDMRRLAMHDQFLKGEVHDIGATDRVIRNDHLNYSLAHVGARRGFPKDDRVEEYVKENKLYTMVQIPGKKTRVKQYHYDKVPISLMAPYGCTDVKRTFQIGEDQLNDLGI